jgi:hypothetical protein
MDWYPEKAKFNHDALGWYLAKLDILSLVKMRTWMNEVDAELMQSMEKLKNWF